MAEIAITLTPNDSTDEAMTNACREWLEARGYTVKRNTRAWENPGSAAERLGVHPFTITRRLHRWEALGRAIPVRAGATGRIIEFQSSEAFDAYVKGGNGS